MPRSGSGLHSAGCCTKQKKSYLHTLQHSFLSYGHVLCLGSHAKSLGGQRAEICHFLVLLPWYIQQDGARTMLKGPPAIAFTDIVCVCDPLAEGGRDAGLGAPEGRSHIPAERNLLISYVPFYRGFWGGGATGLSESKIP